MLSDQRTAALVTPDGRITWFCAPRIDDDAVFAELLGGPDDGVFAVAPLDDGGEPTQSYVGDSLVVCTSWADLSVTDYLDCSDDRPRQVAGRSDLIRVVEGRGQARIVFAPRLDFGRTPTRLAVDPDGLSMVGTDPAFVLRSAGVEWELTDDGIHDTAIGMVDLDAGPVVLEMRCGTSSLLPSPLAEPVRRRRTIAFWADWAATLVVPADMPPSHTAHVRRSALTIKALCHGPTGAILAAPTTSLPERLGGVRNWDYRYCWIRDASLSAEALVRLGSTSEAMHLIDWLLSLLDRAPTGPEDLAPLYTVDGGSLPPETVIDGLDGYAGSRPVRVGNAADHQVQLDVFGPVLELLLRLAEAGAALSRRHWQLIRALVGAVEQRWTEADQGIWEIRSPPRHHVNSKVMCWVTVDRAIKIGDLLGFATSEWHDLRAAIHDDVTARGWNDEVGSFTTAYDGTDLDASVLAIVRSDMLPSDDPRLAATVSAIEDSLRRGDTIYRYTHDDGLTGEEGGFNLMTCWLIDAKVHVGAMDDARRLFDAYLALAGPTGLRSEEVDPDSGAALGNHPQAYSHLGLITSALELAQATADDRARTST